MSTPTSIVIIPAFKRVEYTKMCLDSIVAAQDYPNTTFYLVDDASEDGTTELFNSFPYKKIVITNAVNNGLRNILIDFFSIAKDFDVMLKMDNDCLVPPNWLNDIVFRLYSDPVDILSPNVHPSEAAHSLGKPDADYPHLHFTKFVGGLWAMKTKLLISIDFESTKTVGIKGAWHLLNQIILEKEPRIAWLPSVTVQDMGHWSGAHPLAIKSKDYEEYSAMVGRRIAWRA